MNYYEHHLGDYMRDTAHLSMLEDCAYRRLLDAYYIRERPLPHDLRDCCKLVRATSKPERDAVAYVLREFFREDADGFHQARADTEIARFQDKQRKAKASADARWSHSERNANASPNAMRTHCEGNALQTPDTKHQTPAPPVSTKPPGGARSTSRGSRLPRDWDPGDSGMAFARQHGLANGKAQGELAKFRDHWAAKTGQDATKADWMAAWRNWVRKAVEFGSVGSDAGRGAELEAERTKGVLREMDEAREASQTPEARAAAKRARDLALSAIGRTAA